MNPSLIRRLTCAASLVALIGGSAALAPAQNDSPGNQKKAPPKADPDDDVIVPGRKTKAPPADDDVIVPGRKTKAPAGGSLESLLKQAKLQYEKVPGDDGRTGFKIPVEIKGQRSTVFANEIVMGQTADGTELRAVILGTPVALFPEGYRPNTVLYKTLSDFNESIVFGKGLVSSQGVGVVCPFWLRTADAQTLLDHLVLVHMGRMELKKRVQPILAEE